METRLTQVRIILNKLTDANGGDPYHSGAERFWNSSRDEFVNGPIWGKVPIIPKDPDNSFLVKILKGSSDRTSRMPLGGPYITDDDLKFIITWIEDGAPDNDEEFKKLYKLASV